MTKTKTKSKAKATDDVVSEVSEMENPITKAEEEAVKESSRNPDHVYLVSSDGEITSTKENEGEMLHSIFLRGQCVYRKAETHVEEKK